jgi:GT2 family glycosyltransferase
MTMSVLIPTYRRPDDLRRCLDGLARQTRPPDEVVVVVRRTDVETQGAWEVLQRLPLPLQSVEVIIPGVIGALNAGLRRVTGTVVSITDDDAVPGPHWLELIEKHFQSDPSLGGLGGRDRIEGEAGSTVTHMPTVGRIQWFGRVVGNHHLGSGGPREVDVLKGVNMSYRREAIAGGGFDTRLRGAGAQPHYEIAVATEVKRGGWRLMYDPAVLVDHYPGLRTEGDHRTDRSLEAVVDASHNETLGLLDLLPRCRRVVFLLWAVFVGTRVTPGLVQWLRCWPSERGWAKERLRASLRGRLGAWRAWRATRKDDNVAGRKDSQRA